MFNQQLNRTIGKQIDVFCGCQGLNELVSIAMVEAVKERQVQALNFDI